MWRDKPLWLTFAGSVGDWDLINDADSGCCYYVNRITFTSQWEAPEEVSALWNATSAVAGTKAHGLQKQTLSTMAGWCGGGDGGGGGGGGGVYVCTAT